jgi:hypothetical protein
MNIADDKSFSIHSAHQCCMPLHNGITAISIGGLEVITRLILYFFMSVPGPVFTQHWKRIPSSLHLTLNFPFVYYRSD